MSDTATDAWLFNRFRLLTFYNFQYQIFFWNRINMEPFVQIRDDFTQLNELIARGSILHHSNN
jgi:hypothetical protein